MSQFGIICYWSATQKRKLIWILARGSCFALRAATHMLLAVGHARLGQLDQARAAADRLLEVFPSYPEIARQHLRDWNMSEDHIVRFIDALRKAGLDIADEAPLTD